VGKTNTRSPGRKEKSKREELIELKLSEEEKKIKRLKNKPNKNKPYRSLAG
jgi:hypothetical protein